MRRLANRQLRRGVTAKASIPQRPNGKAAEEDGQKPRTVKTPFEIATALALGFERSSVVKRPFLRIRSGLIFGLAAEYSGGRPSIAGVRLAFDR